MPVVFPNLCVRIFDIPSSPTYMHFILSVVVVYRGSLLHFIAESARMKDTCSMFSQREWCQAVLVICRALLEVISCIRQ